MAHVDAIWVGPSGYRLADGTVLQYGETVCSVPKGEADLSDNWTPVPARKGKPTTPDDTEGSD